MDLIRLLVENILRMHLNYDCDVWKIFSKSFSTAKYQAILKMDQQSLFESKTKQLKHEAEESNSNMRLKCDAEFQKPVAFILFMF